MNIQKTPSQKWYELAVGTQSHTVKFTAANRQFDWLKMSLLYEESDQPKTMYDSYNAKVTATTIQNIIIENTSNTYSIANELKFDVDNADEKHQL